MVAASVHLEGADPRAAVSAAAPMERARVLADLMDTLTRGGAEDVDVLVGRVADCVCATGAGACTVVVSGDGVDAVDAVGAVARRVVDPGLAAWARESLVFKGPVINGPAFDGGPGGWHRASIAAIPLVARGRTIGELRAARRAPAAFDPDEREFLDRVADVAALALDATIEGARGEELAARCARLERVAEAGQLAAGVAHDVSNLVTVIKLYAELLERGSTLDELSRERLGAIRAQADRAVSLAWEVLDTARRQPLDLIDVDLPLFLGEFARVVARVLPPTVSLAVVAGRPHAWVRAEPSRLQQILSNLVANAGQALPGGGTVTIRVTRGTTGHDGTPGRWVRLEVADTGDGISPDVLPRVFDPFFSTKAPGRGSGLGLSQVRSLVAQHGGQVAIRSAPGRGTVVTVWLPAAGVTRRPAPPDGRPPRAPRGTGQLVLVVEPDPDLRGLLVETLTALGYRADAVADGDAALRWLRRRGDRAHVVLSEVAMAGLGGEGLARLVADAWPHLPVVLTTAEARRPAPHGPSRRAPGRVYHLRKPFSVDQLAGAIAGALR